MTESPPTFETLFRTVSIQAQRVADHKLEEHGLNGQQGRMIAYIAAHEQEGVIQKDLEKVFHRRAASITSMLQGLERNGFIERRVSTRDERQKNLFVLPKGKSLIDDFQELFASIEDKILAGFTQEEQNTLYQLLLRVVKNLSN
jgi:DNA-binding MarR family transcriptional regulator